MSELLQRQVAGLSALLDIEHELRQAATAKELAFIIVNRSKAVLSYDLAALWFPDGADPVAVSGVSSVDTSSPFVQWLKSLAAMLPPSGPTPALVDLAALLGPGPWREWGYGSAVHCRLRRQDRDLGQLILFRRGAWTANDLALVGRLSMAFAHALFVFGPIRPRRPIGRWSRSRGVSASAIAVAVLALALPVRVSVVAPATVVPRAPVIVAAPVEGVVGAIEVEPNQAVEAGDLLFQLDPLLARSKLDSAGHAVKVAEANLLKLQQRAFGDSDSRAAIQQAQGEISQRQTDSSFAAAMLSRTEVRASRRGIVVFGDANDWLGKPVTVGERVMTIADPDDLMLSISLPVDDAVALAEGMETDFYLNVAPLDPLIATVTHISYEPIVAPEGFLAYRLKASFADGQRVPRVGLRGTAKIYGDRRPLIVHVLRRPLSVLRRFFRL